VGTFGIGGLLYAASVQQLVNRFGQAGLAIFGGVLLGLAYLALAFGTAWWLTPVAVTAIGLGFYALHNTLQTNATQMTPQGAGNRGRDLLPRDLSRPDAGGRRGRARVRSLHRGAAVHGNRGRAASLGLVVRGETPTPDDGGETTADGGRESVACPPSPSLALNFGRATRVRSRRAPAARPSPADFR